MCRFVFQVSCLAPRVLGGDLRARESLSGDSHTRLWTGPKRKSEERRAFALPRNQSFVSKLSRFRVSELICKCKSVCLSCRLPSATGFWAEASGGYREKDVSPSAVRRDWSIAEPACPGKPVLQARARLRAAAGVAAGGWPARSAGGAWSYPAMAESWMTSNKPAPYSVGEESGPGLRNSSRSKYRSRVARETGSPFLPPV